jgi:hypothetical protein
MTDRKIDAAPKATGFAALGNLAPDIIADDASVIQADSERRPDETPASKPQSALPRPPHTEQPHPTDGILPLAAKGPLLSRNEIKVVLGLAAIVGAIWIYTQADHGSTTSFPSALNISDLQPAQIPPRDLSPAPTPPPATAPAAEILPPVGSSLTLSRDQIRYCLSEDIRLEAARAAVDSYSQFDVSRFNSMITDYNNRCSNFRYRQGSLESVRVEVEANRYQLQTAGAARFSK